MSLCLVTMLPFLGAAVAILVFEAAVILSSTGLCVKHSKLKRRGGRRYKGDLGYGNGYPGTGRRNGVGAAGVIFASGIGDGENGYGGDGGDVGRPAGADYGGESDGGDDGGDGGGDGGGCGGGCGGGGD